MAYTLNAGRKAFTHRRSIVGRDRDGLIAALEMNSPAVEAAHPSVAFLFPGQGAQYPRMGSELYQHERVFREAVDQCASLLKPDFGFDLREALHGHGDLQPTALAQPALFATEYALAQLWMSWGVRPQAMIGHSVGEYVAACLAGVFTLEDALTLVATRRPIDAGHAGRSHVGRVFRTAAQRRNVLMGQWQRSLGMPVTWLR